MNTPQKRPNCCAAHGLFLLLTLLFTGVGANASGIPLPSGDFAILGVNEPDRKITYKQVGDVTLRLDIFEPPGHSPASMAPAIVFFHGGGWRAGDPSQMYMQCAYLASRGVVAISAEYRLGNVHRTTPRECVQDGNSAMRWLRANAASLGINPDRIAAGGASAGAHVAAATALTEGFDEESDDLSVCPKPALLVLFAPVFDNGPGGYGHERVQEYWEAFSPMHNIASGAPPTLVMFGTQDNVASAVRYQARMTTVDASCEVYIYDRARHAHFNTLYFEETSQDMDRYLIKQGWLTETGNDPDGVASANNPAGDPPVISAVDDQLLTQGFSLVYFAFTVGDDLTPADRLTVTGSSSNKAFVPDSNLVFGGSGSERNLRIFTDPLLSGSTVITLAVSDGTHTTTRDFVFEVVPNDPFEAARSGTINQPHVWWGLVAPAPGDASEWSSGGLGLQFETKTFHGQTFVLSSGSRLTPAVARAAPVFRNVTFDGGTLLNNRNLQVEVDFSGNNVAVTAAGGTLASNAENRNLQLQNGRFIGSGDLMIVPLDTFSQEYSTDVIFAADMDLSGYDGTITVAGLNAHGGQVRFRILSAHGGAYSVAVEEGGVFRLEENARMVFVAGDEINSIRGDGTVSIDGSFVLDLSGAGRTVGDSWRIVHTDSLDVTYGGTFGVEGFVDEGDGRWTRNESGTCYVFDQATGLLEVAVNE